MLSVLAAFSIFACDDKPTGSPRLITTVEYKLTADSYDSDGIITIRDDRIRRTHYYSIDFNGVLTNVE